jgi:hypothetical protein
MISQSLFDETLLENQEAFDLSNEEALKETIDQFLSQLGAVSPIENNAAAAGPLSHLVLLHPSSANGAALRDVRSRFETCLNTLDGCVGTDGSVTLEGTNDGEIIAALEEVTSRLGGKGEKRSEGTLPYLCIFRNTSSIYTLMSFLGIRSDSRSDDGSQKILLETIKALLAILVKDECSEGNAIRVELKDLFVSAMGRVVGLSEKYVKICSSQESEELAIVEKGATENMMLHLLQLAIIATKNCESAKVGYVQGGGVKVISAYLKLSNNAIIEATCNLLASLSRYDDFRENAGPMGAAANTSSAHDHALEFHRLNVEERLVEVARGVLGELDDANATDSENNGNASADRLAVAVLTALRVLAVNDDIIQTMVALGVLPVVTKALELSCKENTVSIASEQSTHRKSRLTSASLGLLRNMCGNDEIKTNLCLGSSDQTSAFATPSSLPYLILAMQLYPSVATLQEHACGTLAAMALRKPANAHAIIDQGGPRYILTAMKRHDMNPSVQRQGALAVRNLVSRLLRECPEDDEKGKEERTAIRDSFLELGAEDILRNVTGRHQGSIDEAYAALRDLGCKVSLIKFNGDEQQQGQVQRTLMFGEKHNSNFRPVYDDSEGLEKGVDEAISQFSI